jgi:hypothetical protein
MMKVAICLSGGIRYPQIGLGSIAKIFPKSFVKIFIHTWKIANREDFLKTIAGLQYKEHDKTVETQFDFLQNYQYEKLLIEDYNSKKERFESIYNSLNLIPFQENSCIIPRYDVGPISMHYSIHKSNELKTQYERENDITFDFVIRMRFDSDFEGKKLQLDSLPRVLNIPQGEDWCDGINDQFALGPSEVMNVYSDFYNHIDQITNVQYHPESMLREYLEMKNVEINRIDFPVRINNKIDFRKVMFG